MTRQTLDPVSLEILWTRLISVVDEAAATQERTSFSHMVREANDYAVVVTDAKGRSIAQSSRSIPSFIGTLPRTIKLLLELFPPETLEPGDVIVTNDPWIGTGHLPDINMAMPIFRERELIAFAGSITHVPDIGGRLWNIGIRELFEEGLQIPPLKLMAGGEPDPTLVSLIQQNVRIPEQTMGDIWAQISACRMIERQLHHLIDETGIDVETLGAELRVRSEAAMRAAIRAIPDGNYHSRVENDGFEKPIVIACRLNVRGDELLLDFSGSSPQLARSVNVTPSYAFAYSAFALKCILSPEIPNNEGSFQPIKLHAPPGSILNPSYPAPVSARHTTGQLTVPAVMMALALAVPERAHAPSGCPDVNFSMSGEHRGQRYASINFQNGGLGASTDENGLSATSYPSNVSNTPIELMETLIPMRVLRRQIRPGSGGRGARRGGDGITLEMEFVGDSPGVASFLVTRRRTAPAGILGGGPGASSRLTLNGKPIDAARHWVLEAGDRVLIQTPGGGGYGTPRA